MYYFVHFSRSPLYICWWYLDLPGDIYREAKTFVGPTSYIYIYEFRKKNIIRKFNCSRERTYTANENTLELWQLIGISQGGNMRGNTPTHIAIRNTRPPQAILNYCINSFASFVWVQCRSMSSLSIPLCSSRLYRKLNPYQKIEKRTKTESADKDHLYGTKADPPMGKKQTPHQRISRTPFRPVKHGQ